MATVDLTKGYSAKETIDGGVFITKHVDFSVNNVSASDVVQLIPVQHGLLVTDFFVTVLTAEGGTATADFGDGDDPNGFDDAVNLNATAGTTTKTLEATDAYATGRYYTAGDTIDIVPDHNLDAAKIVVFVQAQKYDLEEQQA